MRNPDKRMRKRMWWTRTSVSMSRMSQFLTRKRRPTKNGSAAA